MADISKITLPSGNTYDIKDTVARQAIAGGVSFIIAWDGNSTPVPANIPAGVVVTYQGTQYTGTLTVTDAQAGAFYLVKSSTTPSEDTLDIYDEYIVADNGGTKFWEKIGDTKADLSDMVTGVTLNKTTTNVIGENATFTVTQPTISLSSGATATTGSVEVMTGITSARVEGDGYDAISSLGSPTTDTAVKSVTPTTSKLNTTSIIGVNGSTTASKVTADTSQTTASGTTTTSIDNSNILKGATVTNETLVLGACTLDTQTTTQFTAADVTVPIADSATTVATGNVSATGLGSDIVTNVAVGATFNAVTGYNDPDYVSTLSPTGITVSIAPEKAHINASATNGNVAWNSKDVNSVVNDASLTVTKNS